MARAETASASARADSIKGLAQSIANPAYRRLLTAEPALRRAVPALIIAFLLTIGVGAVVQVLDHHRQAIAEATHDIDNVADFVSERFDRLAGAEKGDTTRRDLLERALSTRATAFGRHILLSNADGVITATAPAGGPIGLRLIDVLGETQPLTILGASAGVLEITLADGSQAFATVRTLAAARGQLSVFQLRSDALAPWRSDTTLTVTLTATTGFVLLILGFAFHWQATRAREADAIYDTVRSRIDTALNRGRCGLWDWDLARGRIFWSHSMFAILGLAPARRSDDLRRGQPARSSRRHQALRGRGPARRRQDQRHRPRLPHAPRQRQMGLAAGALRAGAAARRARRASDRHRASISPSRRPWSSGPPRPTSACATPSRPSRKPSCCGTTRTAWCCATRTSRICTACPTRRSPPARPTSRWSRPAASTSSAPSSPARTRPFPAPAPSRRSSTTAIGCRSASAAPRTAAMFRSAPTSRR